MPNTILTNKPALVYKAVLSCLKEISFGNGYQTQPGVVENRDAYDLESLKWVIEMYQGDPYLSPINDDTTVGLRFLVEQKINVVGWAYGQRGDVMDELHKLLQDALTAIHGHADDIAGAAGGCAFGISDVVTDQGLLFQRGQATFDFTVTVRYYQDPTW